MLTYIYVKKNYFMLEKITALQINSKESQRNYQLKNLKDKNLKKN